MQLTPIDPRTILSATRPDLGNAAKKARDMESLRQSTREFEALYINEMFKAMRKTIPDGGLIEKGMSEDIYQEMIDMEHARVASEGNGIGLGQAMFEQLRHLVENRIEK
jgi:flagellar protein FlgJ